MKKSGAATLSAILILGFSASPPAIAATNICLAYQAGGLGDRSFNDATLAGVKKAQDEYSFTFEAVVTDGTPTDRERRLRTLISKDCASIIAVGSGYAPFISELATEFPKAKFAIINDASVRKLNVTSIIFDQDQLAFLAGYSAALSSKNGKVAMLTSPISADAYEGGFRIGAKAANKNIRTYSNVVTSGARKITKSLIADGVDVIYDATDLSSNSIFSTILKSNNSKKRKNASTEVGIIITEPDQFLSVTTEDSKYLLASLIKRVDIAVADIIKAAITGDELFDPINMRLMIYGHRYTIADKGVELVIKSKSLAEYTLEINRAANAQFKE